MSFDHFGLTATSLAVLQGLGFDTPTPIQQEALPLVLQGLDVVAQAKTGSGKTLAFGLPLVQACDASKEAQALVLTPTRELAQQVAEVLTLLAKPAGLTVTVLHGGVGYQPQTDGLRKGAQIIVGTPGRTLDHLGQGSLKLGRLRLLVLDEADQMLDRGFAPDVERIIAATPKTRQTVLFSATTPAWVKSVSSRFLREPRFVRVGAELEAAAEIEQEVIEVWGGDKLPVLLALLERDYDGATLVFGRTRHGVMNLAKKLQRYGYQVEALQGDLGQATRDKILARFRSGDVRILLATNVAARGLDMSNIDHVINYDLPESSELFVHRVGRTGRMGRVGNATTLVTATDLQKMQEIERALGKKFRRVPAEKALAGAPVTREPVGQAQASQTAAQRNAQAVASALARQQAGSRRRGRPRVTPPKTPAVSEAAAAAGS